MSSTSADPRRAALASKLLVAILAGIFLFGMLGFAVAVIDAGEEDDAGASPSSPALDASGEQGRLLIAQADPSPDSASAEDASPDPAASPGALDAAASAAPAAALVTVRTPVVPVTGFWSRKSGLARRDLVRGLESGKVAGFKRIVVDSALRDALEDELGITFHPDVRMRDAEGVARAVRGGALGLLSALDLRPSMRILNLDGRELTGNDRIGDVADWPLGVSQELPEGEGWDQERTWVLVAGGDSFTDRGVHETVVRRGKGVGYPFGGGTARVTGHGCCDPVFNDNVVPRYVLTGNKGVVRRLFRGAELAIANHEQPVTRDAAFHSSGLRFSGKPDLTRIFSRAGIDFLSLANNHIGDYGSSGIADSRRILRQHGIAFGGAGKDLEQARRVTLLEARGTTVAIIPCLDIVRVYWADEDRSGATPCLDRYLVPDIKKAKRQADVVIVFPHWGVEYTRQPLPSMRKHAARWAKAGADLILGAHSHVAGAIEDMEGTPVMYSLGNLIFDQHWSTNTMESALLEATFHGDRLVEMRLRPYIIHDTSQPNLLDPARGEGRRLLNEIRAASSSWLDW